MLQVRFAPQLEIHLQGKSRQDFSRPQRNHQQTLIMPTIFHHGEVPPYSPEEILRKASALIIVADSQGAITYVSLSGKTILGYEPGDMLGDKWWTTTRVDPQEQAQEQDYIAHVPGASFLSALSRMSASSDTVTAPYERQLRHRDGSMRWILWEDARGSEGSLIGVGHDLTARKQAEEALQKSYVELESRVQERTAALALTNVVLRKEIAERTRVEQALRESEERFRLMADAAPVLIWMAGTEANCTFFNQRWLDFTGRPLEQERGSGWTDGVHPDDLQSCVNAFLTAFAARQDFQVEYRLRRFDGVYRWLFEIGVPRFASDGEFAGYLGSCLDITERKQVEEAQLRQAVELQQVTEDLQQFARVAAHDLQEPLRTVTSYVQLLAQRYHGRLDSDADEYIGFAVDGAKRLQRLILDLLAYYEVGTRRQELAVVNSDIALTGALADLRGVIAETGAVITNDPLPCVWGDAVMIQLLFRNLLDNGIKFRRRESPQIHIAADRKPLSGFFRYVIMASGWILSMPIVFSKFSSASTLASPTPNQESDWPCVGKLSSGMEGESGLTQLTLKARPFFFTMPIMQSRQGTFSPDSLSCRGNNNPSQRLQ